MGVRRHHDLQVWQLAEQLRGRVVQILESSPGSRDLRFCSQVFSAARSVSSNIADGYSRFSPAEFGQFLRYAHGSLGELRTYLVEARQRGWLEAEGCSELESLAARTAAAIVGLIRYLRSHEANRYYRRIIDPNRPKSSL